MTNFEKLTEEIIKSMAEDGTPVTKEEAQQMAKMEIGAKNIKRYEKSLTPRKKSEKVRKIDPDKLKLFNILLNSMTTNKIVVTNQKNEAEFSFLFNNSNYTVKLIKHRPSKK